MYTLHVDTDIHELIHYLDKEANKVEPRTYLFLNQEIAYKIIARFMLYYVRENAIEQLIQTKKLSSSKKEDFLLYVSSNDILLVLQSITKKLSHFLYEKDTLHFEGFVQFRLKNEKDKIIASLNKALKEFEPQEDSYSNLDSLEDILHEQTSKESQLFILLDENKRIILRSEERVFLIEHAQNEDVILSHLIILAPKQVKVFETHGQLTKESVIILKHLFKDKVAFSREKYFAHRHSKE